MEFLTHKNSSGFSTWTGRSTFPTPPSQITPNQTKKATWTLGSFGFEGGLTSAQLHMSYTECKESFQKKPKLGSSFSASHSKKNSARPPIPPEAQHYSREQLLLALLVTKSPVPPKRCKPLVQAGPGATEHLNKMQQTPNQPLFIPVIPLQEAWGNSNDTRQAQRCLLMIKHQDTT